MILSILIPTLKTREAVYNVLKEFLDKQIAQYGLEEKVTIVPLVNEGGATIGHYRNELVKMCVTPYCWFLDDDDWIPDDAIPTIINSIESEMPDGIGFKGYMVQTGSDVKEPFEIKHGNNYELRDGVYYRPLNHLAPKKTELYRQVPFPELSFGEDHEQCIKLAESGLIKTSSFIDKDMYHYLFNPFKRPGY